MKLLKLGSKDTGHVTYLQVLLWDHGYYEIDVDGIFGPRTKKAVQEFQREHRLTVDGIVGPATWSRLAPKNADSLRLRSSDIEQAAIELEIDVPTIEAVCAVEASGSGFVETKPKILFEGHTFWRRLQKHGLNPARLVSGNQDVLYETWTKRQYRGGILEYQRLYKAWKIHPAAAFESASWGLFQIMGSNHELAGLPDVSSFVSAMNRSEMEHLLAFCHFLTVVKSRGKTLAQYLREHDWASFARAYNGPAYAQNRYDVKLAEAYARRTS